MSRIYKQTSFTSDDLFATVSFGGGGGGGGGGGADWVIDNHYDRNSVDNGTNPYKPGYVTPSSGSLDLNNNGSVMDEVAVLAGVTAVVTTGTIAVGAGIIAVGSGYAHTSGY